MAGPERDSGERETKGESVPLLIRSVMWQAHNSAVHPPPLQIVVLQVGTNNIENTAEEIADGISEAVSAVRNKLPDTYIILPVSTTTTRIQLPTLAKNC